MAQSLPKLWDCHAFVSAFQADEGCFLDVTQACCLGWYVMALQAERVKIGIPFGPTVLTGFVI